MRSGGEEHAAAPTPPSHTHRKDGNRVVELAHEERDCSRGPEHHNHGLLELVGEPPPDRLLLVTRELIQAVELLTAEDLVIPAGGNRGGELEGGGGGGAPRRTAGRRKGQTPSAAGRPRSGGAQPAPSRSSCSPGTLQDDRSAPKEAPLVGASGGLCAPSPHLLVASANFVIVRVRRAHAGPALYSVQAVE